MKRIFELVSAVTLVLVAAVAASASDAKCDKMPIETAKPGVSSLSLAGSFNANWSMIDPMKLFSVRYDYRLTKNVSVGLSGTIDALEGDIKGGPADVTLNYFLPALDKTGETIPYFGAGVGVKKFEKVRIDDLSDIQTKTHYGAQAGIQHYMSNSYAVFGEVTYRTAGQIDHGETSLFLGATAFLK